MHGYCSSRQSRDRWVQTGGSGLKWQVHKVSAPKHPQALPRYPHKPSTQVAQDCPTLYHAQSHNPTPFGNINWNTNSQLPHLVTVTAH